jgi:O-antigen/teichoic acid export membrane protein
MKGVGKTWLAPVFELGGVSLVASCLMGIVALMGFSIGLTTSGALFTVALAGLCALGLWWVTLDAQRRRKASAPLRASAEEIAMLRKGRTSLTIVVLSNFLIQAGSFVIVAPFLSDTALGLARAAERLALVVSFPILAIDPLIAARAAGLFHSGKLESLRRLIRKSISAGVLVAFPPLLAMLFFPELVLSLIGSDFVAASPYLRLLAVTHFVLVLLGPFSMVLAMSGGERGMMWVSSVALVGAVVAYPLLAAWSGVWGFLTGYVVISTCRSLAIGWLAFRSISDVGNRPNTASDA